MVANCSAAMGLTTANAHTTSKLRIQLSLELTSLTLAGVNGGSYARRGGCSTSGYQDSEQSTTVGSAVTIVGIVATVTGTTIEAGGTLRWQAAQSVIVPAWLAGRSVQPSSHQYGSI